MSESALFQVKDLFHCRNNDLIVAGADRYGIVDRQDRQDDVTIRVVELSAMRMTNPFEAFAPPGMVRAIEGCVFVGVFNGWSIEPDYTSLVSIGDGTLEAGSLVFSGSNRGIAVHNDRGETVARMMSGRYLQHSATMATFSRWSIVLPRREHGQGETTLFTRTAPRA